MGARPWRSRWGKMKHMTVANCSASSLEQDSIHQQTSSRNAKRHAFEDKVAPRDTLFEWFSNPRAAEFAHLTSRIVDRLVIVLGATMIIFLSIVQLVTALRA